MAHEKEFTAGIDYPLHVAATIIALMFIPLTPLFELCERTEMA